MGVGISKPYARTCRPFEGGVYLEGGDYNYTLDPRFASESVHYVRSFELLLDDLRQVFDFVEPADANEECYSHRIHALLMRACVEVEANCVAILRENGYPPNPNRDWNMVDYRKIERSHRLSGFSVVLPHWKGNARTRVPFEPWRTNLGLPWYRAYNTSKHDRGENFHEATLRHLIDACCGLFVLLSAQFGNSDVLCSGQVTFNTGTADGSHLGIGKYFRVIFPNDWPSEDRYEFDWSTLSQTPEPVQKYDYTAGG